MTKSKWQHRSHTATSTTELEFDENDEGNCVGYARILKTPEKERRVRITKPIRNDQSCGEIDNSSVESNNNAEDDSPEGHLIGPRNTVPTFDLRLVTGLQCSLF